MGFQSQSKTNRLPQICLLEDRVTPTSLNVLETQATPLMYSDTAGGTFVSGTNALQTKVVSDDGRFTVFASKGQNVIAGQIDGNADYDVFVFDRFTNSTELISHGTTSAITTGNGRSLNPTMSGDGRYVTYETTATTVVAGMAFPNVQYPEDVENVIHYDRLTKTSRLVSHQFNSMSVGSSYYVQYVNLSADGQVVVFSSQATNLNPNIPNPDNKQATTLFHSYAYSVATGDLQIINHKFGEPNQPSNGRAYVYDLSADGRYVVISGGGTNMSPTSPGSSGNIWRYDRLTDSHTLVSRRFDNPLLGSGGGTRATMSADGKWITYESKATTLVSGYSGSQAQIYLSNADNGTTELVSRSFNSANTAGNGLGTIPMISGNGQIVLFASKATNLLDGFIDGNGADDWDVFAYDRQTHNVTLVSRQFGSSTTSGNKGSVTGGRMLSFDGQMIVFSCAATDLLPGYVDGHGSQFGSTFSFELMTGVTTIVSSHFGSPTVSANQFCQRPYMSADGTTVAFSTQASDIMGTLDDVNGQEDVFVRDMISGNVVAASRRFGNPSLSAGGSIDWHDQTADGRYVAYASKAMNSVPGQIDRPNTQDIFWFDRATNTTKLVSHAFDAAQTAAFGLAAGYNESAIPVISNDGRYVAYASHSSNLVEGFFDGNGPGTSLFSGTDIYLYDSVNGTNQLVSRQAGTINVGGNGTSGTFNLGGLFNAISDYLISISDDGRYVTYYSTSTDLVAGFADNNPSSQNASVYLFDRVSGLNKLVSHQAGALTGSGNGDSFAPTISGDGRYITYYSGATNIIAGMTGGGNNIFLYDQQTETNTLVTHKYSSATFGVGGSQQPAISRDGNFIVYSTVAGDLVAGLIDTNSWGDLYLYNRVNGTNTLVSHAYDSATTAGDIPSTIPAPNGSTYHNIISADGRYVVYPSGAGNLVEGFVDNNGPFPTGDIATDMFLFDRVTGTNTLVSHAAGQPNVGGTGLYVGSFNGSISGDGRFVAFISTSLDLVSGMALPANNDYYNAYRYDRVTGTLKLMSHSLEGIAISVGNSNDPLVSNDGGIVSYLNSSDLIVEGDYNTFTDSLAYVTPPPRVSTIQINDGSPQRSVIQSMTITLDDYVFVDSGAVTVASGQGVVGSVQTQVQYQNNTTILTVMLSGAGTEFGSLADGKYTLSLNASKISGVGSLDGNDDGVGGDDYTFTFHRLFGDADGNGTVSAADFNAFRLTYGGTGTAFDFNNDGVVTASDFNQFRLRYGVTI